jgi:predicted permease
VLIFTVLFPVIAVSLLGYLSISWRWFTVADSETLSRLTFRLLIPCLLFVSVSRSQIDAGESLEFLTAYYVVVLFIYVLGVVLSGLFFEYQPEEQSVFAMGCAYSNTTIVGIPVIAQALGEEGLVPLFFIISIQNLVLFTIGTIAAERTHLSAGSVIAALRRLLTQLLGSPITASLIAGLIVNIAGIPIWGPAFASVELLSEAAIPASLFVLGMSLKQYRLRSQIAPAALMTAINILLLPLLVWFSMFHVFEINEQWAKAGVLAAAMPVGISAYVFANRYDTGHGAAAAGSLLSSLVAVFTLSLVLILLQ